jgi:hypothetical protein
MKSIIIVLICFVGLIGLYLYNQDTSEPLNEVSKIVKGDEESSYERSDRIYNEVLKKCSDIENYIYNTIVHTGSNLDLKCLEKKLSFHSKVKPKILSTNEITAKHDNSSVTLMEIKSVVDICSGESNPFCKHNLIIDNDKFIYVRTSDQAETSLLKENTYHIVNRTSTYRSNYIYYADKNKLLDLGQGGTLEFEEDTIIKYGVKSYWDGGGAFWFNLKIDYEGNYIELINEEDSDKCYPFEKFNHKNEEFKNTFKQQGLKELCVWEK